MSIPKTNIPDNFDFLSEKLQILKSDYQNYKSFSDQRFSDIDLFAKGCVARLDALDNYAHEVDSFAKNVIGRLDSIDSYINFVNTKFNNFSKSVNQHIADLESQNRVQRIIQRVIRKLRGIIRRGK